MSILTNLKKENRLLVSIKIAEKQWNIVSFPLQSVVKLFNPLNNIQSQQDIYVYSPAQRMLQFC